LKPTQILKGKSLTGDGSQWLRKGLVVFQFVITITLISSIVIIQKQLDYIRSKSLGFNAEQTILIPMRTGQASSQYQSLQESFRAIHGVKNVSAANSIPSTPHARDWLLYKEGLSNDQAIQHEVITVDQDYFKTMDIDFVGGRDFNILTDNLESDTTNVARIIVNEATLYENQIPLNEALNTALIFEINNERYILNIIGVVKDFHQFSLHRKIPAMVFMLPGDRSHFSYVTASVEMGNFQTVKTLMKNEWDKRVQDAPFETIFLDQNVQKLYENEARTSTILSISTVIALVISCLGLYGLSVYIAERKTKEIGIRKVVGASVETIVGMLSKEYIKLVVIAFAISVPLGWYFMERWLSSFAYRIEPDVMIFVISGAISFGIAWLTVSFESFRAANRNPVETLRNS
jgi:putative ABC transport system permease protein